MAIEHHIYRNGHVAYTIPYTNKTGIKFSLKSNSRLVQKRASQLYGMGNIGGFCHLYIGQEAVVVGVLMTINQNDSVVTTYRDHGHMIARGLNPKKIMAELTGRKCGYSSG